MQRSPPARPAGTTALGDALGNFGTDLQDINSDALMNGPSGDPQAIQAVAAACNAYNVTIRTPGGVITPTARAHSVRWALGFSFRCYHQTRSFAG